jgi:hypothetical protein
MGKYFVLFVELHTCKLVDIQCNLYFVKAKALYISCRDSIAIANLQT